MEQDTRPHEEIFWDQLCDLHSYGCPQEIINHLMSKQDQVINASKKIGDNCLLPFLPVLPKSSFELIRRVFLTKHGVELKVAEGDFCDGADFKEPYYLIGVKLLNPETEKESGGCNANFSEIIALSLFSNLPGPFYAYWGCYIPGGNETGIWFNTKTGSTGPFLKHSDPHPIVRSTMRLEC